MTYEEKTIINYPDYTVDTQGIIKRNGRVLKQFNGYKNYQRVDLSFGGRPSTHSVARIVALHFLTPEPSRPFIDHINGDKKDNRVTNLRYCNASENNCNKKSKGYHCRNNRYIAYISKNNVKYTKSFTDKWRAIHWRICKEIELFGNFARRVNTRLSAV